MAAKPSQTGLYPSIELYTVDPHGASEQAENAGMRAPLRGPGHIHPPALLIVSGPLGHVVAREHALQIAMRQTDAVLRVAVCEIEGEPKLLDDTLTSDLFASFDAVLAVTAAQRGPLLRRLLRTVAVLDSQDQWITCDWNDVRTIAKASGRRLVRYGFGRAAGDSSAAHAAAAAIAHIETQGSGLHTASGICIGIHGASKAIYGRVVKEVLHQVRARVDSSTLLTMSIGCDSALQEGSIEVTMFAFGERDLRHPAHRGLDDVECVDGTVDNVSCTWDGKEATLDPLYAQARVLLLRHQCASISLVQRHLRIGYSRACRLMDALEGDILSAKDPSGIRTVLLPQRMG